MQFRKYMHVERFGTVEVEGIEIGECYVFPKIDGTNASVWLDDEGNVQAGSRERHLSCEKDNAGFCETITRNEDVRAYLTNHPNHRLFGEWLVLHSLKTYRKEALRKFYIFDVAEEDGESFRYIPYNEYKPLLEEFNLNYIPPIAKITNGSYENFINALEKNNYLIEDGKGVGEGIVIKNFSYKNKFGRICFAKIVTSEFKELHTKAMGAPEFENKMVEQEIIDIFLTTALIEKEYAKIVNEMDGWSSKYIPRLLQTVFYSLVKEEIWAIVKQFKMPTINFKTLNFMTIQKIKEVKSELFR